MEKIRDFSKYIRSFFKRMSKTIKKSRYGFWVTLALFLVISVFIELFIFNFRHWQTLTCNPLNRTVTIGDGFVSNGDGTYHVVDGDHSITINDIPGRLHILYTNVYYLSEEDKSECKPIDLYYHITDEGATLGYDLNRRVVYSSVKRSRYTSLYSYGDIYELRIEINPENDKDIYLEFDENVRMPIFFEMKRVMLLFVILVLIWMLKPGSVLHEIRYLKIKGKARIALIAGMLLFNYFSVQAWGAYNKTMNVSDAADGQYQDLAEAFKKGQVSLLDVPSDTLKSMSNPYDYEVRISNGSEAKWDTAYYNGKYYVYFGVVPELLFYYPHYVFTSDHIENHKVISICLFILIWGMIMLFDEVIKRYYTKCSVAIWFISLELAVMSSNICYAAKRSYIYNVPIICAIMLAVCGMWAYIRAIPLKKDKSLHSGYLFLGSLLTALVAGCRPQLFVIFFIDMVILWKYVFRPGCFTTKKGIKTLAAIAIPMLVVAAGLMSYNAARFGSPFDFGAKYNLTGNNQVADYATFGECVDFFKALVFEPVKFTGSYPFMEMHKIDSSFLGREVQSDTFGGVLFTYPFLLLVFLPILFGKEMKKRSNTAYCVSLVSGAMAVLVCVVDSAFAGIFYRYTMDFTFLLVISAVASLWLVIDIKDIRESSLMNALVILLIIFLIYEFGYCMLAKLLDEGARNLGLRQDLVYRYMYLYGFMM